MRNRRHRDATSSQPIFRMCIIWPARLCGGDSGAWGGPISHAVGRNIGTIIATRSGRYLLYRLCYKCNRPKQTETKKERPKPLCLWWGEKEAYASFSLFFLLGLAFCLTSTTSGSSAFCSFSTLVMCVTANTRRTRLPSTSSHD